MNTPSEDRAAAIRAARTLVACRPLVLDTETTGLGEHDQIVEISVVDYDGTPVFANSRVRPTVPIPAETAKYHGITDADVANCPTFAEIWPDLLHWFSGRHIAAYNADYDIRMMRQSLAAHTIPDLVPRPAPNHCIMQLFAAFYGDWSERHGSYRYKKLSFAANYFGLPSWVKHGSLADAQAARLVLQKMAESEI